MIHQNSRRTQVLVTLVRFASRVDYVMRLLTVPAVTNHIRLDITTNAGGPAVLLTGQGRRNRYETDSLLDRPMTRKSTVLRSYTYHSSRHEF
jgi:hypothetical protein